MAFKRKRYPDLTSVRLLRELRSNLNLKFELHSELYSELRTQLTSELRSELEFELLSTGIYTIL